MKKQDAQSEFLTIGKAAALLGVSTTTLRNWDNAGKIQTSRHPINNYRLYKASEINRILKEMNLSGRYLRQSTIDFNNEKEQKVLTANDYWLIDETAVYNNEEISTGEFAKDRVVLSDCISGMRTLHDSSIDVAIVDPPYNASKGGKWEWDNSVRLPGFGGNWSKIMASWDNMTLQDYLYFTISWLKELKRIVKPTGSFWIHGTYHNIGIINFALQLLEIEIINEIVWYKRNSFPNLSGRRLTASHETILWAHTGKKRRYFFNYDAAKNLLFPEDQLKAPGKQMRTVWDIPNNKDPEEIAYGKHPTQKPLRLLKRMIILSAKPRQLLLSPFAGSGSDCVAAKMLSLNYLGFEVEKEYFDICEARLYRVGEAHNVTENSESVISFGTKNNANRKNKSSKSIPSLIKWTGSKRGQASRIYEQFPPFKRYFEPFLGGGALLFLIGQVPSFASDIYKPLIDFWKLVQKSPEEIVSSYKKEWGLLQDDFPEHFYKIRDRFNKKPNPLDLCFLARTCVNGIIRFNDNGEFNNSFHLSRKGMNPEIFKHIVDSWHGIVQDTQFKCCDYEELIDDARSTDFVYFDPPYSGNRNRYVENLDTKRFFNVLEKMNISGVRWALSFDGFRGATDLRAFIPQELYKRHILLSSGHSKVKRVLSGDLEQVRESLYLNY